MRNGNFDAVDVHQHLTLPTPTEWVGWMANEEFSLMLARRLIAQANACINEGPGSLMVPRNLKLPVCLVIEEGPTTELRSRMHAECLVAALTHLLWHYESLNLIPMQHFMRAVLLYAGVRKPEQLDAKKFITAMEMVTTSEIATNDYTPLFAWMVVLTMTVRAVKLHSKEHCSSMAKIFAEATQAACIINEPVYFMIDKLRTTLIGYETVQRPLHVKSGQLLHTTRLDQYAIAKHMKVYDLHGLQNWFPELMPASQDAPIPSHKISAIVQAPVVYAHEHGIAPLLPPSPPWPTVVDMKLTQAVTATAVASKPVAQAPTAPKPVASVPVTPAVIPVIPMSVDAMTSVAMDVAPSLSRKRSVAEMSNGTRPQSVDNQWVFDPNPPEPKRFNRKEFRESFCLSPGSSSESEPDPPRQVTRVQDTQIRITTNALAYGRQRWQRNQNPTFQQLVKKEPIPVSTPRETWQRLRQGRPHIPKPKLKNAVLPPDAQPQWDVQALAHWKQVHEFPKNPEANRIKFVDDEIFNFGTMMVKHFDSIKMQGIGWGEEAIINAALIAKRYHGDIFTKAIVFKADFASMVHAMVTLLRPDHHPRNDVELEVKVPTTAITMYILHRVKLDLVDPRSTIRAVKAAIEAISRRLHERDIRSRFAAFDDAIKDMPKFTAVYESLSDIMTMHVPITNGMGAFPEQGSEGKLNYVPAVREFIADIGQPIVNKLEFRAFPTNATCVAVPTTDPTYAIAPYPYDWPTVIMTPNKQASVYPVHCKETQSNEKKPKPMSTSLLARRYACFRWPGGFKWKDNQQFPNEGIKRDMITLFNETEACLKLHSGATYVQWVNYQSYLKITDGFTMLDAEGILLAVMDDESDTLMTTAWRADVNKSRFTAVREHAVIALKACCTAAGALKVDIPYPHDAEYLPYIPINAHMEHVYQALITDCKIPCGSVAEERGKAEEMEAKFRAMKR